MNPLSHGSINGPKEDTNSPAKQMADQWLRDRAKLKAEQDRAAWLYNLEREVHV
jgi:hypothetical protein